MLSKVRELLCASAGLDLSSLAAMFFMIRWLVVAVRLLDTDDEHLLALKEIQVHLRAARKLLGILNERLGGSHESQFVLEHRRFEQQMESQFPTRWISAHTTTGPDLVLALKQLTSA